MAFDEPRSLGYQGIDIDSFVRNLFDVGIQVVIDVRLNPVSRKPGFSKNALRETLQSHGITYRHEGALGNPQENRAGYAELASESGRAARDAFTRGLTSPEGTKALARTAELSAHCLIGVLCFESDDRFCHRREVLCALTALRPNIGECSAGPIARADESTASSGSCPLICGNSAAD